MMQNYARCTPKRLQKKNNQRSEVHDRSFSMSDYKTALLHTKCECTLHALSNENIFVSLSCLKWNANFIFHYFITRNQKSTGTQHVRYSVGKSCQSVANTNYMRHVSICKLCRFAVYLNCISVQSSPNLMNWTTSNFNGCHCASSK